MGVASQQSQISGLAGNLPGQAGPAVPFDFSLFDAGPSAAQAQVGPSAYGDQISPVNPSSHNNSDMLGLSPTTWLNQLLHSATANPTLPLVTPSNLNNNSGFDWGFSDFTQNIFDPIATRPPSPVQVQDSVQDEKAADDELVVAVSAEEVDGRPHAKELPDGRPPESPWVYSTLPRQSLTY